MGRGDTADIYINHESISRAHGILNLTSGSNGLLRAVFNDSSSTGVSLATAGLGNGRMNKYTLHGIACPADGLMVPYSPPLSSARASLQTFINGVAKKGLAAEVKDGDEICFGWHPSKRE